MYCVCQVVNHIVVGCVRERSHQSINVRTTSTNNSFTCKEWFEFSTLFHLPEPTTLFSIPIQLNPPYSNFDNIDFNGCPDAFNSIITFDLVPR